MRTLRMLFCYNITVKLAGLSLCTNFPWDDSQNTHSKGEKAMKRIVTRLISILLVTMMCISVLPVEVFAWGKMTHVYTANIIEGLTAEGTGSIAILDGGDSAFEYDIPDEYYEAIMAYPDAFRAGALGPDVYPDRSEEHTSELQSR